MSHVDGKRPDSNSNDGPGTAEPEVSKRDVRMVVASSVVGTTVEWYDFFLYGTAAGIIFNKYYFPTSDPLVGTLLAFTTFALGFVARPIGGLIFGHLGDRLGRKRTLVATMLIMGIATALIGLLPTYEQIGVAAPLLLVLLRLLQGVAIGGEWGGAVLMAVEYAPSKRRGFYGSFPQLGLAIGLLLGTAVFAALDGALSDDAFTSWGWRIAFLLSLVLVVVGMVIRLRISETPAFRRMQAAEQQASVPALDLVRSRRSRRHLLLGMGSRWIEGLAYNAWAVFAIAFGTDTLKMPKNVLLLSVMAAATVMAVLIPIFGALSDRVGRRRLFGIGTIITGVIAYPAFAAISTAQTALVASAIVVALGICYPVMYGPQAAFYAEMFPARVRCTGISFVYQFSGIFASGLTPLILAWLIDVNDGGHRLVALYLIIAAAISAVCTFAVRPRDLRRTDEEDAAALTRTKTDAVASPA